MLDQLGGRKFALSVIGLGIAVLVPIVYKKLNIDDTTAQLVVGIAAAVAGTYGVTNVMADKVAASVEKKDDEPKP